MNSFSYTDIEILKTESFFTNEDLKNEKNVWNSIKKKVLLLKKLMLVKEEDKMLLLVLVEEN